MTYGRGTNIVGNTSTGDNNIDGLIANQRWQSRNVTFSFTSNFLNDYEEESGYQNSDTHRNSFESLNPTQREFAHEWARMYEDVSGLNLIELTGANERNATIRIAESDDPHTAYAYLPGSSFEAGDIWFSRNDYNEPTIGNYAYHTFGHELGHALGLEHGHEANGIRGVAMNADRDSMEFSIMTYRSYINDPLQGGYSNERWGYAQSLMMYDIAAIQHIYGANFNTNSSNTTYTFSALTGEMFVNGIGQGISGGNRIFRTIWDGNGIDTYDFSNYNTNLSIDLHPGAWVDLNVGGNAQRANLGNGNFARAHVFNALQFNGDSRSLIENANGGSGNDKIIGNNANNVLNGNGGNDTLDGSWGFDTLDGGTGIDTATYDFYDGGIEANLSTGIVSFPGNSTITEQLISIENIIGSNGSDRLNGNGDNNYLAGNKDNDTLLGGWGNDSLDGGEDDDFLFGNFDNDTLNGDGGNDYLHGFDGNDSLNGGNGNDTLIGLKGSDTLTGGAGNDRFSYFNLSNHTENDRDVITDLNLIEDVVAFHPDFPKGATGFHHLENVTSLGVTSAGVYWDSNGNDNAPGQLIAILQGHDANELNLSDRYFENAILA